MLKKIKDWYEKRRIRKLSQRLAKLRKSLRRGEMEGNNYITDLLNLHFQCLLIAKLIEDIPQC